MKIDRLFGITNLLIDKKSTTAHELAELFEVSVRTIYRDLEALSANGIPLYTTSGKGGGVFIMDGYSVDKAMLSDEEQGQILAALHGMNATGQLEVSQALSKMRVIFQKEDTNWIEIDFSGWSYTPEDKLIFQQIKTSIIGNTSIRFRYFNNKGKRSERKIDPVRLVFKSQSWYVYGFCHKRQEYRFFKLTRMEQLEVLPETFQRSLQEQLDTNYSQEETGELVEVHLKISEEMAFRVYDEFRMGTITKEKGYFHIVASIPNNEMFFMYLLGYGDSLEVLGPKWLRKDYGKKIEKIMKKYL